MTIHVHSAATFVYAMLRQGELIKATKFIRDWADCRLRTAVEVQRAIQSNITFDDHSTSIDKIDKIESMLQLAAMAEVVNVEYV
jgi:hypothetical protein